MSDAPKRATVGDIQRRLRDRFPPDRGWTCMQEVTPPSFDRDGKRRRFDAIAINLWPSTGLSIHGFEIKVSRADWRNELADPSKAGALMRWCDRYWLVCPPDVTDGTDLPASWGLIHATTDGLRQKRAAPALTAVERGADFWCCMMLRLVQRTPATPADLAAAGADGYKRGLEDGKDHAGHALRAAERTAEYLRAQIDAFEKAAGFPIAHGGHGGGRVGAAVRLLTDANVPELADRLGRAATGLRSTLDHLDHVIAALAPPTVETLPTTPDRTQ